MSFFLFFGVLFSFFFLFFFSRPFFSTLSATAGLCEGESGVVFDTDAVLPFLLWPVGAIPTREPSAALLGWRLVKNARV